MPVAAAVVEEVEVEVEEEEGVEAVQLQPRPPPSPQLLWALGARCSLACGSRYQHGLSLPEQAAAKPLSTVALAASWASERPAWLAPAFTLGF